MEGSKTSPNPHIYQYLSHVLISAIKYSEAEQKFVPPPDPIKEIPGLTSKRGPQSHPRKWVQGGWLGSVTSVTHGNSDFITSETPAHTSGKLHVTTHPGPRGHSKIVLTANRARMLRVCCPRQEDPKPLLD